MGRKVSAEDFLLRRILLVDVVLEALQLVGLQHKPDLLVILFAFLREDGEVLEVRGGFLDKVGEEAVLDGDVVEVGLNGESSPSASLTRDIKVQYLLSNKDVGPACNILKNPINRHLGLSPEEAEVAGRSRRD